MDGFTSWTSWQNHLRLRVSVSSELFLPLFSLLFVQVLVEKHVRIIIVLENRHETVADISSVLIFVLLLCSKNHVLHCIVYIFLFEILDLKQNGDDQILFQFHRDFVFLVEDSLLNLLLVLISLVWCDSKVSTFLHPTVSWSWQCQNFASI